ncbi:hypothetical protein [Streptomyces mayonensis]|uniref:hypothetical protein n=1 Tax=Streptomyces mayonensis TaxID=2750816 RepID=UPI001C1DD2C5|nr:hypothetical protein [Streptomyces sp. A108]MBU6530970.1 hypothetical protein [Streptomyces sp. A108]
MSTGFVDALTAVSSDQGDECAGPGNRAEGKLHQVERLGVELCGGVDLLELQQVHPAVEDAAGHQDRGDAGDDRGRPSLHSRNSRLSDAECGRRLIVMKMETKHGGPWLRADATVRGSV